MINIIFLFFIGAFAADPDPILSPTQYSSLVDGSGNLIGSSVSGTSRGLNVYDIQAVSATQSIISANNSITTSATVSMINNMNSGSNKVQLVTPTGQNYATSSGTTTSATLRVAANNFGEYAGTVLPEFTSGTMVTQQFSRRGVALNNLWDTENSRSARIDSFNSLKTAEFTRLIGGSPDGPIINPFIWTVQNSAGASVTQVNNLWLITTGTTENASASLTSVDRAPSMSGLVNSYFSGVRLPVISVANNERRWGAFTATDGLFFKLDSGALSVCKIQTGVETCIPQASWNGAGLATDPFVLTTNFTTYEIHYSSGSAQFWAGGRLLHNFVMSTSSIADTLHFPTRHVNQNKNGSTTNVEMFVRGNGIHRFGRPVGRPRPFFTASVGTTVLKREPGTLHKIKIGRQSGLGNSTLTIYDNTAATGTIIDRITLAGNIAPSVINYDIDFNIGLTIVNDNANNEVTVMWE